MIFSIKIISIVVCITVGCVHNSIGYSWLGSLLFFAAGMNLSSFFNGVF